MLGKNLVGPLSGAMEWKKARLKWDAASIEASDLRPVGLFSFVAAPYLCSFLCLFPESNKRLFLLHVIVCGYTSGQEISYGA
jgi:hypothetical protein